MSFCNTHLSIREDMLAQTEGKIKENIFKTKTGTKILESIYLSKVN